MSETSAVLRDGRSGFDTLDLLALGLLIDDLTQRRLVAVLELVRFEVAGLGLHNVLREIEHLLLDLDVRNVLKIVRLVPDLVGVAQERAHQVAPLTTSCAMRATTSFPSFESARETGSMRRATQKA